MTRTWLFQRMTNDVAMNVPGLVSHRIFQTTKMSIAPKAWPFILYRQTSDTQYARGDDRDQCRSNGYMLFAHDKPGDYLRIETVIGHLRRLFADIEDQANGIIRCTWLDTSEDFRDEDMGTIFKFGRIQVIYRT